MPGVVLCVGRSIPSGKRSFAPGCALFAFGRQLPQGGALEELAVGQKGRNPLRVLDVAQGIRPSGTAMMVITTISSTSIMTGCVARTTWFKRNTAQVLLKKVGRG
jgi:hypothetical protein